MEELTFTGPGAVDLDGVGTEAPRKLNRDEIEAETARLGERLAKLQDLMFFAGQTSLLVVLQGMDCSGKDGTIRRLLGFSNAQGTRVCPFKVPTPEELAHDFLWRVHKQTPGKGEMVVFNRSHYEDVLVVRVHEMVQQGVWKQRYERINEFERLVADSGTVIEKFFLHISKGEQEVRLLEREQETTKAWKLSAGDWKERERWGDYREAYEDAIGRCASEHAPWTVVPADNKWYRDYVVLKRLVETLERHEDAWMERLEGVGAKAKEELAAYRAGRA